MSIQVFPAPTVAGATKSESNPGRPLSDLLGMSPGIVGHRVVNGVVKVRLQCSDCHTVEEPPVQLLATILHHPNQSDGLRRCKPCRIVQRAASYPDCVCHLCMEDAA